MLVVEKFTLQFETQKIIMFERKWGKLFEFKR